MVSPRLFLVSSLLALAAVIAAPAARGAPGGEIEPVEGASSSGDLAGIELVSDLVGMATTPSGNGYWMVAADGGVFGFGDAAFHGSMGGTALHRPVVGIASTPTGNGYWLVASDGGVFSFGDARFHGSTGAIALHRPITGVAATATGAGYWLVADDGGVFAFGDAPFLGSTGGVPLNRPIVDMAATPTGKGYWLVADDGGVFTFGDADYHGSSPADGVVGRYVALLPSSSGNGYSLVASTGELRAYGDATVGRLATCDEDPVIAAGRSGPGGILLRVGEPIPSGVRGAAASTADSDHMTEFLRHLQACQTLSLPAAGGLGAPISHPVVTSRFGPRTHPIWRVRILHAGVDYISGVGSRTTLAAAAGVVVAVDGRVAYGSTLIIDHGNRIASVYAHLATVSVEVGDTVVAGQAVGTMGATGFATGTHLHYEVRVDGVPVNPDAYVVAAEAPEPDVVLNPGVDAQPW